MFYTNTLYINKCWEKLNDKKYIFDFGTKRCMRYHVLAYNLALWLNRCVKEPTQFWGLKYTVFGGIDVRPF